MHDPVAEACKRGDRLAAQDRKKRDREADPQARQDNREGGRQQHPAEQLIVGGAHRARRQDVNALDIAEARDRVEDDWKEARANAERDLRRGPEPEEQDVERQEQDDRDRIDAGEQRLEHADRILRAADQIAEDDTAGGGDRERDRELEQGDAQVAHELECRQHVDELVVDPDRIGEKDRADLPIGRADIPKADECNDEGSLDQTAPERAAVALRAAGSGAHD